MNDRTGALLYPRYGGHAIYPRHNAQSASAVRVTTDEITLTDHDTEPGDLVSIRGEDRMDAVVAIYRRLTL